MKFARQVSGGWCDPREAASLQELDYQYNPGWVYAQKLAGTWFQPVSDGIYASLMGTVTIAPVALSWDRCNNYLIGLLATDTNAGAASLQDILEKCRDATGTTQTLRLTRYFYTWFLGETTFTKDAMADRITAVSTTCITTGQKNSVINNWPNA